ncbi:unnamed protein product [Rodentolepis nana]|uniref:ERCC4 domain-containing protein n=1 Tax=Rodentolepis nana TaxID=102285 RepID=A0A0R3T4T2_RODNA|nr:unnamed protein product [Rodentolepis nana]
MTAKLEDIMAYDRLSSTSTNSYETDSNVDRENLLKRRHNMQLIYDVVKKMCDTKCEVAFIFDPAHPCKLVDYPERDEEAIRRWNEAIQYIRDPRHTVLKLNSTPISTDESVKRFNSYNSSTSSSEKIGKSLHTMRFANNLISLLSKDPALYVCTMHILRDKLIGQPKSNGNIGNSEVNRVQQVNKIEKESCESPMPTWLKRLEYMASDVKPFKMPFTHLMPPHPEEIFQTLGDSQETSTKSDRFDEYLQEDDQLFDSSSQKSLFSSTLLTGRDDNDNGSQDRDEQSPITRLLEKLRINANAEELKLRDNMMPHTPSSSTSTGEFNVKTDTPLTAAYKASGLNICKTKKDQQPPNKALFVDYLRKMDGESKQDTSDSTLIGNNFMGPQEIGYQCPCYFEKYIDTTTNLDMQKKLQLLRGSRSNSHQTPTNKEERKNSPSLDFVSNINNYGDAGIDRQVTTKPPVSVRASQSNQRSERTAQEFIADAIAAARRSSVLLHGE